MAVSEFKARGIAALKEVQRTREPLVVTLRGKTADDRLLAYRDIHSLDARR